MSNRLLAAAAALVVVGVGLLSAPFFTGNKMEQSFRELARAYAKTGALELYLVSYERGFYASDAVTRLQVPGKGGEAMVLELHHHIVHGMGLGGLNYGEVTTTLAPESELGAAARTFFGDKPPLRLVTVFGLAGAVGGRIYSPPVESKIDEAKGSGTLNWLGVSGEYSVGQTAGTMQLNMPGFVADGSASGNVAQASMSNVTVAVDMFKGEESGAWMGKSATAVGSIAVDMAGKSIKLNNMSFSGESSEKDGTVTMSVSYSLGGFSADDVEIKDFALRISINNIDAAALKAYSEAMDQASAASEEEQMALMMQSMQLLPKLLARRPALNIDEARLKYNGAPVLVSGGLRYVGNVEQGFNPIADIEGEVSLQAPHAMLIEILAQRARKAAGAEASTGDPMLDAAPEADARLRAAQTLQQYVDQGLLVPDGEGVYKTMFKLGDGKVTVNSLPFTGAS